jgi:hypothetical protein
MTTQPKFKVGEKVYKKVDCGRLISEEEIMLDLCVLQHKIILDWWHSDGTGWHYTIPLYTYPTSQQIFIGPPWLKVREDQLCTFPELIALAKERAEHFLDMIEKCGGVEHCLDPVNIGENK